MRRPSILLRVLALSALGLLAGWAQAQTDWSALARPVFRHLGFDEGLPHPIVTALAQDRSGFVWIGTQGGLARYDGHRLQTVPAGRAEGQLHDPFVQALQVDGQDRLWIGTRTAGLQYWDAASERVVALPGLEGQQILALLADARGLWVGTEKGLWRVEGEQLLPWKAEGDGAAVANASVQVLHSDGRGGLWIGGSEGLAQMRGGQARRIGELRGVTALHRATDGTLWWASSNAGVGRVRGDGETVVLWSPEHALLAGKRITGIQRVSEGELWVAGYGMGIARWPEPAGGAIRHDPYLRSSLASDGVRAVMRDRSGLIWVGGDQGVDRYDPAGQGFVNLLASPQSHSGLADRHVLHIGAAQPEGFWLGYGSSGLTRLRVPAQGWADLQTPALRARPGTPALAEQRVLATAQRGDRLWIGTLNGLFLADLKRGEVERLNLPGAIAHPRVEDLLLEGEDLWIASAVGLWRQRAGRFEHWSEDAGPNAEGLSGNWVNTLFRDARGRLWIGTNGGLSRWLGEGRFLSLRHQAARADGLCHADVVALTEDGRGRLWVATLGGGICRLDDEAAGRFTALDRRQGLPHDNVGALRLDEQGLLWVSTADGLARVDPERLDVQAFGVADGVALRSYWIDSSARAAQGEIFFGGGGGLVVVRPAQLAPPSLAPPLAVSELRVDGKPMRLRNGQRLELQQQGLQIEFAALDFAAPERWRYRYRLLGLDERWQDADATRRIAAYGRLAPGQYRFQLQALNRAGTLQSGGLEWSFEVLPAWYQSWIARGLGLLLLVATIGALVHQRARVLQARQRALELKVAQRTSELSVANQTLARSADTLRLLGDTGRALTQQLDLQAICWTLHRQLAQLMPLDAFGVALLEAEERQLRFLYYFEDRLVQGDTVSLDDPNSLSARAFREDRELDVLGESESAAAPEVAGIQVGEPMRSLVFRPLQLNQERFGIVTVQSRKANAYGAQELEVFRALSAYTAIAIGNARAFAGLAAAQRATAAALQDLQEAQDQLVEQAKLASLGQLVAGVAHEVNTPLGVAVTANSHLGESAEELRQAWQSGKMAKSTLSNFLDDVQRTHKVLQLNLGRAADLVAHFKEVSVDRTSDGRRRFELAEYLGELLESLRPSWRHRPIELRCELPAGLWLDSFPGALGQVVGNLVQNALLHAFAPEQAGRIDIEAQALDAEHLLLVIRDDGRGIAPEHLARVFEPFFTTKRGQGGTGLGLNIAYNLVVQKLGGELRVHSEPGQGCRFELRLPRVAPSD